MDVATALAASMLGTTGAAAETATFKDARGDMSGRGGGAGQDHAPGPRPLLQERQQHPDVHRHRQLPEGA